MTDFDHHSSAPLYWLEVLLILWGAAVGGWLMRLVWGLF